MIHDVQSQGSPEKIIERFKIDLYDETIEPQGLTGTWTSITIIYAGGGEDKINNISPQGELMSLYEFIEDKILEELAK